MGKKTKTEIRITSDPAKAFFDRVREHARKLDRGEELAPETIVWAANLADLRRGANPRASNKSRRRRR
jgi:hypothetical protein